MLGRLKGCSNGRVTLFIVPDIIFFRKSQQWVVKTEGSGFESFYNTCFCYKIFGKVFALFCGWKRKWWIIKANNKIYLIWSENRITSYISLTANHKTCKNQLRGLELKAKSNNLCFCVGISNFYCVNDLFIKLYKAFWFVLYVIFHSSL